MTLVAACVDDGVVTDEELVKILYGYSDIVDEVAKQLGE